MTIPGFVDLQVNGYMGVDYSSLSLTETGFIESCKALKNNGTVAFLPTIVTASEEIYEQNLAIMCSAMRANKEVQQMVLGFHIEGPFLSLVDGARGAHPKQYIQKPNLPFLKKLINWSEGNIKLLTIASELEGAKEVCGFASEQGITISLGHQIATYQQIAELHKAGARGLTHLGNANPHLVDRHKNALISGLASDDLIAMMITDGFHIPEELIKLIWLTRGSERCFIVSDASPFAGMPEGHYSSLGLDIRLDKSGKLYNNATGYLVGSSYTMLECANYMASLGLVSEAELEKMVFYNPLDFLGVDLERISKDKCVSFSENKYSII